MAMRKGRLEVPEQMATIVTLLLIRLLLLASVWSWSSSVRESRPASRLFRQHRGSGPACVTSLANVSTCGLSARRFWDCVLAKHCQIELFVQSLLFDYLFWVAKAINPWKNRWWTLLLLLSFLVAKNCCMIDNQTQCIKKNLTQLGQVQLEAKVIKTAENCHMWQQWTIELVFFFL